MTVQRLHELLERIDSVQDQTDVDLLLFFFRHPNALLTVEFLAAAVGHDQGRVEESLKGLIEAGLIERVKGRTVAAHSFLFRPAAQESVGALLQIASSRPGRLALLDVLQQRATTMPPKRKA
ncbi:MAG TPA: hypothetical protein VL549_14255 [Gemmatimonadales bacterium]|jgi:predicted transcriptional regulator|nr:hypothetical protein [Gemmatimonadales bacterium]